MLRSKYTDLIDYFIANYFKINVITKTWLNDTILGHTFFPVCLVLLETT